VSDRRDQPVRHPLRRFVGNLRRSGPKAPPIAVGPTAGERPPAIFLIGCQRSGTSLLRRIVDSHPSIACPPETAFILPLVQVLHDERSRRGFEGMGYARASVVEALAAFIATFYEGYAAAQGKPRWADKTPHYVDCLDDLWTLFGPTARFVVIVRNGLDVAFSLADPRRHYPAIDAAVEAAGGDVPSGAGRFWSMQNRKILDFTAAHPEACVRITYEDLTRDPGVTLEPVFSFLGVPWDPAVLDYASVQHHAGVEDPDVARMKRIVENSGKSSAWSAEMQAKVREACEPELSELGYS
jgi:protein-tyrosine sulfotransferase